MGKAMSNDALTGRIVVLTALIVVTAGCGAHLAMGLGYSDDQHVAWHHWHLEAIQSELADLGRHLRDFRAVHGRYPTNDEGLAALDNFDARFRIVLPCELNERLWPRIGAWHWPVSCCAKQARNLCFLKEYREATGRAPQSQKELCWVAPDMYQCLPGGGHRLVEREIAISKGDHIFVTGPAGVYTPWELPYVYENRSGHSASAFAGSGVEDDPDHQYSIRVDEGVYVWSVGGREWVKQCRAAQWDQHAPKYYAAGLLGVSVLLLIRIAALRAKAGLLGLGVLVCSCVLGAGLAAPACARCVVMKPLFTRRPPSVVARQKRLLAKYHAAGVIGDEAYREALAGMDGEAASRPATRPGEGG